MYSAYGYISKLDISIASIDHIQTIIWLSDVLCYNKSK